MKFRIRYNKTAGQPNRGSVDHKWRVFDENGKEYICKEVEIYPPCRTEPDPNGNDWNIATHGTLEIIKPDSKIIIHPL
jgi:hypothetical protein